MCGCMLKLYFSCSQVQLGEAHCKNKWPTCMFCMHIFICILHGHFLCVCDCKSRGSQEWIKYVNMHYLFLLVLAL